MRIGSSSSSSPSIRELLELGTLSSWYSTKSELRFENSEFRWARSLNSTSLVSEEKVLPARFPMAVATVVVEETDAELIRAKLEWARLIGFAREPATAADAEEESRIPKQPRSREPSRGDLDEEVQFSKPIEQRRRDQNMEVTASQGNSQLPQPQRRRLAVTSSSNAHEPSRSNITSINIIIFLSTNSPQNLPTTQPLRISIKPCVIP